MTKIIIDGLGSDLGPEMVREAVELARKKLDFSAVLVGPKEVFSELVEGDDQLSLIDTREAIDNNESPALAIRRKKQSSMVLGLQALNQEGDVFLTAGSSGALLAGAYFITKRLPSFRRFALAPVLPNIHGGVLLADAGASMDSDSLLLFHFAQAASLYASQVLKKDRPKVALLNVGTEAEKGDKRSQETYTLLAASDLNFIGNVEARDIFTQDMDVLVTDGFAGNVALKSLEGTAGFILKTMKEVFLTNTKTKLGALLVKKDLKEALGKLDYRSHGGAPLLGPRKPLYKAHGNSTAETFALAIQEALAFAQSKMSERLALLGEEEGDLR